MKLSPKKTDKLMEIAIMFGVKVFFPVPVTGEDKRSNKIIQKGRVTWVQELILDTLARVK